MVNLKNIFFLYILKSFGFCSTIDFGVEKSQRERGVETITIEFSQLYTRNYVNLNKSPSHKFSNTTVQ